MEAGRVALGAMEFGVLGPLLVRGTDGALALPSAKQRSLLATLVLEARHDLVPAERLIDELWGEAPPATAAKALQVHVSQLRRALGREDLIVTRPGGYAIQIEPGAVDLHRFQTRLARARQLRAGGDLRQALSSLEDALALWRGPALADVTLLGPGATEGDRLDGLRASVRGERLEL